MNKLRIELIFFLLIVTLIISYCSKPNTISNLELQSNVFYMALKDDSRIRPAISICSSSVLYVDSEVDIYLIPFSQGGSSDSFITEIFEIERENRLDFSILEHIQEIKETRLEIMKGLTCISTRQFEYNIVPFKDVYRIMQADKVLKSDENAISFWGFKIPLEKKNESIRIRLQNKNGKYYPNSFREIRIIKRKSMFFIMIVLSLFPIIIVSIIFFFRQLKYSIVKNKV